MEEAVAGTSYGGMYHDCVFKSLDRHYIRWLKFLFRQFRSLVTGLACHLLQILDLCRDQSRTRQGDPQRLRNDLHGRSGSHERTGTTFRAGILFVGHKLFFADFLSFVLCAVGPDLFKSE